MSETAVPEGAVLAPSVRHRKGGRDNFKSKPEISPLAFPPSRRSRTLAGGGGRDKFKLVLGAPLENFAFDDASQELSYTIHKGGGDSQKSCALGLYLQPVRSLLTSPFSCPEWRRNGFCTNRYYSLADRRRYCGVTCQLCDNG